MVYTGCAMWHFWNTASMYHFKCQQFCEQKKYDKGYIQPQRCIDGMCAHTHMAKGMQAQNVSKFNPLFGMYMACCDAWSGYQIPARLLNSPFSWKSKAKNTNLPCQLRMMSTTTVLDTYSSDYSVIPIQWVKHIYWEQYEVHSRILLNGPCSFQIQ